MNTLLISRIYAIFVGFCLLGGQVFFSRFDLGATIAGICGMLASIVGENITAPTILKKRKTMIYCIGSGVGLIIFGFTSFVFEKMPLYYFPWFIILPFCLALYIIASKILKQNQNDTK